MHKHNTLPFVVTTKRVAKKQGFSLSPKWAKCCGGTGTRRLLSVRIPQRGSISVRKNFSAAMTEVTRGRQSVAMYHGK
jgi:hypothetical protein